jgi:hypothetical protein
MGKIDYWVELKGDWWCVCHESMEKPLACFLKKKQAVAFMEKEIERNNEIKIHQTWNSS